ncbi:MAG: hypothetical protein QOD06_2964 [Candidatus Binatota bacterium]|nr:hypothetical protein [Candidatus Binatota bacterium]
MYEFLEYHVRDAMTVQPITIRPEASLADAERRFEDHDFNCLPVVEHSGRLLGVLTKLDVLQAFAFDTSRILPPYDDIMRQAASLFKTPSPITFDSDTPLTRVLEAMLKTRCKSFPVVDGGRLTGIIAREDVLRALRCAVAGRRPEPRQATSRTRET